MMSPCEFPKDTSPHQELPRESLHTQSLHEQSLHTDSHNVRAGPMKSLLQKHAQNKCQPITSLKQKNLSEKVSANNSAAMDDIIMKHHIAKPTLKEQKHKVAKNFNQTAGMKNNSANRSGF
mmetsp:Transcript_17791/g.17017  ORF Transcript_17791/g.17017 Transcript_17791/m.17017 type:complete len:121 (+) Transcript_17791:533-895(+)